MANVQNFGYTEGGAAQITVPVTTITATVDEGGEVIADYTGANALRWPECLAALDPDQRAQLLDEIAITIVLMRAGVL